MELELKIDVEKFRKSVDDKVDVFEAAFATARNMVASMLRDEVRDEIASAGRFDSEYLEGLTVEVDDESIRLTLDAPGADIFANGGTIEGNPLLWIPISGTDAQGIQAKDYGDQLFSVNRKAGGVPLLFSVKDRAPKYFGVPSVTIPQKFNIPEIMERVMGDFPEIFADALKDANG